MVGVCLCFFFLRPGCCINTTVHFGWMNFYRIAKKKKTKKQKKSFLLNRKQDWDKNLMLLKYKELGETLWIGALDSSGFSVREMRTFLSLMRLFSS